MKAIVTGGAGFIGSALVRRLVLVEGWSVTNIDALTYAGHRSSLAEADNHPGHTFVQADIADHATMKELFARVRPDVVFHLAAESHVDRSIDGADAFVRTNVTGTFALLEAARAVWAGYPQEAADRFRFVHVSTDEVYGSLGETGLFRETTPYDPRSPYSATKAASDHLASAWHHTYGMPVCISNCSNNYGPFQLPEKLIPLTILNALACQPLPVYGTGTNVRDWLHVDDHVDALIRVALQGLPGRSYNVGGHNERRNIDVVRSICRILDEKEPLGRPREELIQFVTDRPGHDARYAIDASRIRSELGWLPSHDFESGLRSTVAWYLANEAWWSVLRTKGHGTARLGLSSVAHKDAGYG